MKGLVASITDLSRSRTQVHRQYKCSCSVCEMVKDVQLFTWATSEGTNMAAFVSFSNPNQLQS